MADIDSLLEQLRALEGFVKNDDRESVIDSIVGLRRTLMRANEQEDAIEFKSRKLDLAIEHLSGSSQSSKVQRIREKRYFFDNTVECYGWYPAQIDSSGRDYRWCGEFTEAGIILSGDLTDLNWMALSVRPLLKDQFTKNAFLVHINNRPVPFELKRDGDHFLVIMGVDGVEKDKDMYIRFYLFNRKQPSKLKINKDSRMLAFNVFEIIELHKA